MVNEILNVTLDEYGIHLGTSTSISNLCDTINLNDFYSNFVMSFLCEKFQFVDHDDGDHIFVADLMFGGTLEFDVVLRIG